MILLVSDLELLMVGICIPVFSMIPILFLVWFVRRIRFRRPILHMSVIVLCFFVFIVAVDQAQIQQQRILYHRIRNSDNTGALYVIEQLREYNWLYDGTLSGADLSYANLSNADLSNVEFREVNLSHAILSGANLSGAELALADLSQVIAENANFSGANLNCTSFAFANLHGSDFSDTHSDYFPSDMWRNSTISFIAYAYQPPNCGPRFFHSILTNADFTRASYHSYYGFGANFEGANLEGAHLSESVSSDAIEDNNFTFESLPD